MAASVVQIYNLAISHLGVGKLVQSTTERSTEVNAMNLFYEPERDDMLRSFAWPWAKKTEALALVTETGDDDHPTTEWTYSYRYPSDCLKPWRILSDLRVDHRLARESFDLALDTSGTLIYADKESAVLEYTTSDAQNPGRWHYDFALALSYRLALRIAPLLTKGDPFKLQDRVYKLGVIQEAKARANAANEIQPDAEPDGELILARY